MHKRYNFELVENEPDMKVFRTTADSSHPDDDCWVYLIHDYNDLEMDMVLRTNVSLKDQFDLADSWWKEIVRKAKMCYRILTNQKIDFSSSFAFRGRNHVEDFCDMVYLLGKEIKQETNELIEVKKQLKKSVNDKKETK